MEYIQGELVFDGQHLRGRYCGGGGRDISKVGKRNRLSVNKKKSNLKSYHNHVKY